MDRRDRSQGAFLKKQQGIIVTNKFEQAKLFSNDLEVIFVRRPNRFLIIAEHEGKEIPCHCPNPGRLIEFFGFRGRSIPGIRLILEKRKDISGKTKTSYTAVGLYYTDNVTGKEVIVPLFSSRANNAAKSLVVQKIINGLKEVKTEYTIGGSRFDFFCTDNRGRRHLVEVKACSLVEHGVAMFPDAPSERALKHLEELAELSRRGYQCHVLFIIVHSEPEVFIPDFHTDPVLAAGFSRLGTAAENAKPLVQVHAALLKLDRRGGAVLINPRLPVDLSWGKLAENNSGSYLLVLEIAEKKEITVGNLGRINFMPGWYVYAGSAMKNLDQRITRHQRKIRKSKHWHLDYLTPFARGSITALPIRSFHNLECALAGELLILGGVPVKGFGSSDCKKNCPAHLYYFSVSPLENRSFIAMLFRYRHREALRKL
ncbi:MAG: DNA/RNA nuclease SfsA [Treponema sp.]|nr:DNA/RNA nuclease SfsA [Treponema sp.]